MKNEYLLNLVLHNLYRLSTNIVQSQFSLDTSQWPTIRWLLDVICYIIFNLYLQSFHLNKHNFSTFANNFIYFFLSGSCLPRRQWNWEKKTLKRMDNTAQKVKRKNGDHVHMKKIYEEMYVTAFLRFDPFKAFCFCNWWRFGGTHIPKGYSRVMRMSCKVQPVIPPQISQTSLKSWWRTVQGGVCRHSKWPCVVSLWHTRWLPRELGLDFAGFGAPERQF